MIRSRVANQLILAFGALLLVIGVGDAVDVVVVSGGLFTPAAALFDLGMAAAGLWCLLGGISNQRRSKRRPHL
jgi:hypothetical protein